jgi:excisionase family DNA binding protein
MEENQIIDNRFWDIEDLSNYLNIKVKTIYSMVPDIPHYRVGKLIRFKKQEIDAWMENKSVNAYGGMNKSRNMKGKKSKHNNIPIDKMIRKAIDQSKTDVYNPYYGKSDRIEGPKQEVEHGSI